MREEARLPHRNQVAKSAHMVVKFLYLLVDGIRVAAKDHAFFDLFVKHRNMALLAATYPAAAQGPDSCRNCKVARGILEMVGHLVVGQIPEQLLGACPAFGVGLACIDETTMFSRRQLAQIA